MSVRLNLLRRTLATLLLVLGVLALGLSSANAAYPGRDGRIAFVRANQVFTINPDGSGQKQLTTDGKNYRPRFSPDGTQIAYVHEDSGGKALWLMSPDGTSKRRITPVSNVSGAAWSPNGQQIAYATGSNHELALITRKSDGTYTWPAYVRGYFCDVSGDTTRFSILGTPAWSSTGVISFGWYGSCDSPDYALMTLDMKKQPLVAKQVDEIGGACCDEGHFEDPAWSPTSSRLSYSRLDYAVYSDNDDLIDMPDSVQTVNSVGTLIGIGAHDWDKQPAYSPTGSRMAVTNTSNGSSRIYVFYVPGGSGRRLLTTGYQPDWQPLPN